MEILGFISAVLGIVAAIINRKRIVVLRREYGRAAAPSSTGRGPVTIGKRFKRFLLALGAAMLFPCIAGAAGATEATDVLMWPFGIFLLVAAYQFVAICILIVMRIWQ